MEEIFERLRNRLSERRGHLNDWLQNSAPDKKEVLLGEQDEKAVGEHIHVLDESIEKVNTGEIGICKICHEPVETALLEVDYTADVCLSHLSGTEADELQNEIELAQNVQKSLLPQEIPPIPGLDSAAFSRPAQYIGGDYFDFINFEDGSPGLIIADVAGHGVSASLQMAGLQALTRAIIPVSESTAEAVSHIHQLFIHNILFTTFVTLFVGAFDSDTRTLTYCNAGHNPPLVIRRNPDGSLNHQLLKPTGAAIGLIEDSIFRQEKVVLQPGDLLLIYTDGVVEAPNQHNILFGQDRLIDTASELLDLPAREVLSRVRETLTTFVGSNSFPDDTTYIICKIL
jgi:sigma-B regulation protein RsbU (phosphoserine phosphatase)